MTRPVTDIARRRVILDCDPGLDDAVAIAVAFHWAEVVGITTVGGNVGLEHTTANALALCDLLGRAEVPVHAGHDVPLSGSLAHRATEYHGPFALGDMADPSRRCRGCLPPSPTPPRSGCPQLQPVCCDRPKVGPFTPPGYIAPHGAHEDRGAGSPAHRQPSPADRRPGPPSRGGSGRRSRW